MFAITAGFHRYFSHKAYRLSRVPQFLLALLGQTAAQKGVLWWASNHRHHHKYSDRPRTSTARSRTASGGATSAGSSRGKYDATDFSRIPDLAKFPELVWLDRNQYAADAALRRRALLRVRLDGPLLGLLRLDRPPLARDVLDQPRHARLRPPRVSRRPTTRRNSLLFALVTMGEGWHNNHHWAPGSAAQGFRWWQVDASYYLLWLGEKLGLVRGSAARRSAGARPLARPIEPGAPSRPPASTSACRA